MKRLLPIPLLLLAVAWSGQEPLPKPPFIEGILRSRLSPARLKDAPKDAPAERLAELLSPEGREKALDELRLLEKASKDKEFLLEVLRGYLTLGKDEDGARIAGRLPQDSKSKAKVLSMRASSAGSRGDWKAAAQIAAQAAALNPEDAVAQAVLKLAERHSPKDPSLMKGSMGEAAVSAASGQGGAGPLMSALAKAEKSLLPPAPLPYHMPDTQKPGAIATIGQGLSGLFRLNLHRTTPEEAAELVKLRQAVDSSPAGADLVKRLGGWQAIDKDTLVTFSSMPDERMGAYFRPLSPLDLGARGKKYVLAINSDMVGKAPEAVAPILAHEMRHLLDYKSGNLDMSVALTSEHAAHLEEIYVFKELEAAATPERRAELGKDKLWMGQRWLSSLWEDRLLQLNKTKEDYQNRFPDNKKLQYLSGLAYEDVYKKVVPDGTPQVLYHVSDLYAAATNEGELTEEQLVEDLAEAKTPAEKRRVQRLLDIVRRMKKDMMGRDEAYRIRTGQTL